MSQPYRKAWSNLFTYFSNKFVVFLVFFFLGWPIILLFIRNQRQHKANLFHLPQVANCFQTQLQVVSL